MEQDAVIRVLEESEALLNGHFELRSGLHSGQFFQCANALRYPDVATQLCEAATRKLLKMKPELDVDCVVSPALGGIVVGHEVARVLGVKSVFAEKQEGRLVMRRFNIERGSRVVVAEDVVTRGGRVKETIELVEQAGAAVVGIVLLVDRSGGNASFGAPAVSLVQMAPETWMPGECPLCRQNLPLVHPGS